MSLHAGALAACCLQHPHSSYSASWTCDQSPSTATCEKYSACLPACHTFFPSPGEEALYDYGKAYWLSFKKRLKAVEAWERGLLKERETRHGLVRQLLEERETRRGLERQLRDLRDHQQQQQQPSVVQASPQQQWHPGLQHVAPLEPPAQQQQAAAAQNGEGPGQRVGLAQLRERLAELEATAQAAERGAGDGARQLQKLVGEAQALAAAAEEAGEEAAVKERRRQEREQAVAAADGALTAAQAALAALQQAAGVGEGEAEGGLGGPEAQQVAPEAGQEEVADDLAAAQAGLERLRQRGDEWEAAVQQAQAAVEDAQRAVTAFLEEVGPCCTGPGVGEWVAGRCVDAF